MGRYVLINVDSEDVEPMLARVAEADDAVLIDRTGERAVLVEASETWVARAREALPGWRIVAEADQSPPRPPFPRPAWSLKGLGDRGPED